MFWQNSNCRWMKTYSSSILAEFLCACSRKLLGLVWLLLWQLLLFLPGVCAIISWRLPPQVYFFVMCSMQSCTSVETRSIANWIVYMLPCAFSKAEKPSSAICVIVEQKLCGCLIKGMSFLVDLIDSDIRQLRCGNDQLDVKSNAHGGQGNNFIPLCVLWKPPFSILRPRVLLSRKWPRLI